MNLFSHLSIYAYKLSLEFQSEIKSIEKSKYTINIKLYNLMQYIAVT